MERSTVSTRRTRLPKSERRRQIIEATLRVVGECGIRGTTTARVAAAAGVSEGTLYRHFASRDEMVRAAIHTWFDSIDEVQSSSEDPDPATWLRKIVKAHVAYLSSNEFDFARPFLAFAASPAHDGFREELDARQLAATQGIADIIDQGKARGIFAAHVHSEQIAWEIVEVLWGDVVARSWCNAHYADGDRTAWIVDHILDSISAASA